MLAGPTGRENIVIRGARLLDPSEGLDATIDVRIDNGVIAQLGEQLDTNEHRVVDAGGLILAPAFIDPHVHLRTPGREDEETISSGTAAAAAGGYCAILAVPNTDPVIDDADTLRGLRARAEGEAEVPVGFMAALTKGQDGWRGRAGAVAAGLGLGGWPSLGESLMVARDIDLAGDIGQPVHLMHLSARQSVEHLRRAHAAGIQATGEVTPHHLCLTDEAVRTLDPNVKMNPPLRTADDRAALVEAVRDGTIAAIATDHAPHSPEEKDVPFEAAPFGVTGLETSFAVLYTELVEPGLLPLETVLLRMSAGPAAIFGLECPRIVVGARANLTLIDPNATWRVKPSVFRSRSANSWLLGRRLRGRVKLTIAAGRLVFEQ